jgi:hypothetical protein
VGQVTRPGSDKTIDLKETKRDPWQQEQEQVSGSQACRFGKWQHLKQHQVHDDDWHEKESDQALSHSQVEQ